MTATCDPGTVTNEAGAMAGRSLLASHPAMRPRRRLIACARRQRAIGTPKLAFTDTGIASHLLGQDSGRLGEPDGTAGPMVETFVLMELARQLTWCQERARPGPVRQGREFSPRRG